MDERETSLVCLLRDSFPKSSVNYAEAFGKDGQDNRYNQDKEVIAVNTAFDPYIILEENGKSSSELQTPRGKKRSYLFRKPYLLTAFFKTASIESDLIEVLNTQFREITSISYDKGAIFEKNTGQKAHDQEFMAIEIAFNMVYHENCIICPQ